MSALGFIDVHYQREEVPIWSRFTESFYREWVCWFVSNAFFHVY